MPRLSATAAAATLFVAHLGWVGARFLLRDAPRRLEEVADHERRGPVAWHLDNEHRSGAAAVTAVLDATPPDCVVLWSGQWKGAMEFVPRLIAPRLLVDARDCPVSASTWGGLPLATLADTDGTRRVAILHGADGSRIELHLR